MLPLGAVLQLVLFKMIQPLGRVGAGLNVAVELGTAPLPAAWPLLGRGSLGFCLRHLGLMCAFDYVRFS